jgi:hypothetical protein
LKKTQLAIQQYENNNIGLCAGNDLIDELRIKIHHIYLILNLIVRYLSCYAARDSKAAQPLFEIIKLYPSEFFISFNIQMTVLDQFNIWYSSTMKICEKFLHDTNVFYWLSEMHRVVAQSAKINSNVVRTQINAFGGVMQGLIEADVGLESPPTSGQHIITSTSKQLQLPKILNAHKTLQSPPLKSITFSFPRSVTRNNQQALYIQSLSNKSLRLALSGDGVMRINLLGIEIAILWSSFRVIRSITLTPEDISSSIAMWNIIYNTVCSYFSNLQASFNAQSVTKKLKKKLILEASSRYQEHVAHSITSGAYLPQIATIAHFLVKQSDTISTFAININPFSRKINNNKISVYGISSEQIIKIGESDTQFNLTPFLIIIQLSSSVLNNVSNEPHSSNIKHGQQKMTINELIKCVIGLSMMASEDRDKEEKVKTPDRFSEYVSAFISAYIAQYKEYKDNTAVMITLNAHHDDKTLGDLLNNSKKLAQDIISRPMGNQYALYNKIYSEGMKRLPSSDVK